MKKFQLLASTLLMIVTTHAQKFSKGKIKKLKAEVAQIVEDNHKQSQVMVDKIFSFAELGLRAGGSV